MATKLDVRNWVRDALEHAGGESNIVGVARYIWEHHESDLRRSGDLFYTWQYDMRWAAERLRKAGAIRQVADSPRGIWQLKTL